VKTLTSWSNDDGALHHSFAGGIISEALPVVVVVACLPSLVLAALFELQRSSSGGCFAAILFFGGYFAAVWPWRMLCRRLCASVQADALPSGGSGGCFATSCRVVDLCFL